MAGTSRKNDRSIRALLDALGAGYGTKHARAKIEAYRYNPGSIRVRITDPDFHGLTEVERENAVWPILENLPDDVRSEISMLLLVTPHEPAASLVNLEFDDPSPSRL